MAVSRCLTSIISNLPVSLGIEPLCIGYILWKTLSKGPKMILWPLQVDIMITQQPLMKKNTSSPIFQKKKKPKMNLIGQCESYPHY